jgi:two-component system, chemotaxis family, protein-glutamate methylesterase/glutaminase
MGADTPGEPLRRALNQLETLICEEAKDGAAFKNGHLYMAPSDHHLMIMKGKMLVTKGARENRSRPGIDPLFRSAAVAYRSKVIGVILTGYLDDGTAGMLAIKRCGGVCVVQDPVDAAYPNMPQNVLKQVKADHVVPLAGMGALLAKLLERPARKDRAIPSDVAIEARIAERVLSDLPSVEGVGDQVPFNWPGCGGLLWEVAEGKLLRYRCHTGHAYTSSVLLAEQTAKIEETLWIALRMFEERRNLLTTVSDRNGRGFSASATARAKESEVHIDRIRTMLRSSEQPALKRRSAVARRRSKAR